MKHALTLICSSVHFLSHTLWLFMTVKSVSEFEKGREREVAQSSNCIWRLSGHLMNDSHGESGRQYGPRLYNTTLVEVNFSL